MIREASALDIPYLVTLVDANTKANVTDKSKGFIQTPIPAPVFSELLRGLYIIEFGGELAGFTHCGRPRQNSTQAILRYMLSHTSLFILNGTRLLDITFDVYGPCLMDSRFRGHGLYHQLFDYVCVQSKKSGAEAILAFVDSENPVSLKIHNKLGMVVVDEAVIDGNKFYVVAKDFRVQ